MHRTGILAASLLLLVVLAPAAHAQASFTPYDMVIEVDEARVTATLGQAGVATLTIHDRSYDGPGGLGGLVGEDTPVAPVNPHTITLRLEPRFDDPGWTVSTPRPVFQGVNAGETVEAQIIFQVLPAASIPEYPVDVNVTLSGSQGEIHQVVPLSGFNPGIPLFAALGRNPGVVEPNEIISADVRIVNLDLQPRAFDMEVVQNPCHFTVVPPQNNLVAARSEAVFTVDMQAPDDKAWYFYESCSVRLSVTRSDDPDGISQTVVLNVQVNGGHFNPVWMFWTVGIAAAALILFFLVKRRKERIEEEILGKPQKPWTIPAEKVYLEALEEKDPRAAYVVRHYLMEDEYHSALLWYHAEKKATKGQRKKEGLVLQTERAFEKHEAKWQRRLERPEARADRRERRLQKKLDRKADKKHRKARKQYEARVDKIEEAYAKQEARALDKWEKQVRRAEKKGEPAPERPDLGSPRLPEEPQREPVALADHRFGKKAARYRRRMERKAARLERKYAKDHERSLRRARRKAQRIARKIDDPDFVAEHPLLSGEST